MANKIGVIALAGLLHDIGKVGQRGFKDEKHLSAATLGMADYLCPTNEYGRHSYKHVLFTNEFCELIKESLPRSVNYSEIANLASYHHKPSDELQRIISKADQLSAALDREAYDSFDSSFDFRKTQLKPVSGTIAFDDGDNIHPNESLELNHLSADGIFPKAVDEPRDQTLQYHNLWNNLTGSVKNLKIQGELKYINSMISILEKYLWAVPSATNMDIPDISLFDHLKATSAIAACLYLAGSKEKPFILAAGDFGGIQKYIFSIKRGSGRMAKALRGRSFKVNAFSDSAAFGILNELGLPLSHLILAAGGKFYLLLPNEEKVIPTLRKYRELIHEWIIEKANGELRFALDWIPVSVEDDKNSIKNFPGIKDKLDQQLIDSSLRGLTTLYANGKWNESEWLRPGFAGKNEELCKSCQANPVKITSGGEELCEACADDREIGRLAVKSKYMANHLDRSGRFQLPLASYDLLQELTEGEQMADLIVEFHGKDTGSGDKPIISTFKNNYIPISETGDVLEFGEIAEKASGKKYLGYLKADVDNLGLIFSKGLATGGQKTPDRRSISRVTTLSRSLEYFFSGYLRHFLESKYPNTYTVFSGGDDLLLIGPWDQVFALAADLQEDFARYTCHNKAWGLSAGIAVVGSSTPILHAQDMVKRSLELSKERVGKNCITAFSTTMSWEEYRSALKQALQLARWMEDGTLNTGKVFRLFEYGQQLKEFATTGNTAFLKAIPQMIYDMTRNWKSQTDQEIAAKRWAHAYTNPEYPGLKFLPFICQYALYKTK
jgi:CRISPR-associated protein Csm1